MTYDEKRKTFDCVATMREIRDRISSEIADKTYDDLVHWLHDHHYTDPVLQRLAIWSREGEPLDDPANNRAVVLGQRDAQTGEPYPSYKSSGVEWLGQVPAHWKVVQLRRVTLECCDGPFGTGLKSSHHVENGVSGCASAEYRSRGIQELGCCIYFTRPLRLIGKSFRIRWRLTDRRIGRSQSPIRASLRCAGQY